MLSFGLTNGESGGGARDHAWKKSFVFFFFISSFGVRNYTLHCWNLTWKPGQIQKKKKIVLIAFECETSCFINYCITHLSSFFIKFLSNQISVFLLTKKPAINTSIIRISYSNTSNRDIRTFVDFIILLWHCRIISENEGRCRHNRKTCLMSQRLPSRRHRPLCCIVKKEFRGERAWQWHGAAHTAHPPLSSHHHLHAVSNPQNILL